MIQICKFTTKQRAPNQKTIIMTCRFGDELETNEATLQRKNHFEDKDSPIKNSL
jgi:hypothetical protein